MNEKIKGSINKAQS